MATRTRILLEHRYTYCLRVSYLCCHHHRTSTSRLCGHAVAARSLHPRLDSPWHTESTFSKSFRDITPITFLSHKLRKRRRTRTQRHRISRQTPTRSGWTITKRSAICQGKRVERFADRPGLFRESGTLHERISELDNPGSTRSYIERRRSRRHLGLSHRLLSSW